MAGLCARAAPSRRAGSHGPSRSGLDGSDPAPRPWLHQQQFLDMEAKLAADHTKTGFRSSWVRRADHGAGAGVTVAGCAVAARGSRMTAVAAVARTMMLSVSNA